MNRRHFLLSSLGTTLALPSMSSLLAKGATGGSVQAAKGAGMGARRFVAIGNLLGYQTKSLFPTTRAGITRRRRCWSLCGIFATR
jgi:hypothetical protein